MSKDAICSAVMLWNPPAFFTRARLSPTGYSCPSTERRRVRFFVFMAATSSSHSFLISALHTDAPTAERRLDVGARRVAIDTRLSCFLSPHWPTLRIYDLALPLRLGFQRVHVDHVNLSHDGSFLTRQLKANTTRLSDSSRAMMNGDCIGMMKW